ncbi:hypothetical protein KR093_006056 [Drosophila rubida]|uniref:Endothelin-converting enzyme-like 1 n=1 Tax=Drosophila rubida TaxID=30044 RepID=A0AAD4KB45_9MUSC|nr:hypothetical protein KR093_006056 [Drosophila rubida]
MCKLQLLPLLLPLLLRCSSARHPRDHLGSHMDAAVDACADFYGHACGGWAQAHPSDVYYSQLGQLDHEYTARLVALLQRPAKRHEPRFVQLLRSNYRSCRRQRDAFQATHFVRFLLQWSRSDSDPDAQWSWQPGAHTWRLLALLKLEHRLQLLQQQQRLSAGEQAAVDWLRQICSSWPGYSAAVEADVAEFRPLTHAQFRRLERQLQHGAAQLQLWPQIAQLEAQLSELPEDDSEQAAGKPLAAHRFPEHWLLPLPLQQPRAKLMLDTHWRRYRRRLASVLGARPAPLLLHYALLRLLHKLQLRVPPLFTPHACAAQTHELLPHAAVWLLQQEQPPVERQLAADALQQLFAQLRQRFELRLHRNRHRFAADAQHFLLDKLRRMRLRLSVLPGGEASAERALLEAHYAPLQLTTDDYFGNLLAILRQLPRWQQRQDAEEAQGNGTAAGALQLLLLQPDGYGSYASPYFMPGRNMVMVPHSLLAPPIYWPRQAAVLTQSALGFLIGHELSHAFSPTDVAYDGRGRLGSEQQLRQLQASRRFVRQTECFRSRYQDMADEKFCDVNGLALAYDAFAASSEAGLVGNQSLQQLFFLNAAQFFCEQEEQLPPDSLVHGGSRQRINDAFYSLEAFSRAFDCDWRPRHDCHLY